MDEEIQKIGIKAYTLKLLKEKGLFEGNLFISSQLPIKDQFEKELISKGFKEKDELSCRFSNPSRAIHFPRETCSGFGEAYKFFKKNYKKGDFRNPKRTMGKYASP